ncbi:alpha-mannosidase [Synechococcus sp. RSCCF101]|uniref:glycoside hydrolase family 38 N-terminal domain-containing protein n=1 Tax=Synechococcus sp. RSCCF101 TaxID=2511069 RepID=UPI001CD966CE|nr:alpha-mannosidase [Synechococcus sp. RSCCF101]
MQEGCSSAERSWIDTFRQRSQLDLKPLWRRTDDLAAGTNALSDGWAARNRPDWQARGLIAWPRGRRSIRLLATPVCPHQWRGSPDARVRLDLCWWAEEALLRVNGSPVHSGDLFDSRCRWLVPEAWRHGAPLTIELVLTSPAHDDGALVRSALVIEPTSGSGDPQGWLLADRLALWSLPAERTLPDPLLATNPSSEPALHAVRDLLTAAPAGSAGPVHLLGHAHLDLAWLWPVADTGQAALRTFRSVLGLMERFPELHFGHSTPALYAWLEQHHPALLERIRAASRSGRWEPLNGPWVETDAVLPGTGSLLRQCQDGQLLSRRLFPEWTHELAWLPDSFGFSVGLPSLLSATTIRWFCTHKLAWNETHPFPHRLFRWRGRCGSECLALMLPPIGTDADPVAIAREQQAWLQATDVARSLWLPGLGDHGGGPTAEMLEQLRLWSEVPGLTPRQHGSLRDHLATLEPLAPRLPVWRDELYLELHRGCATTRPDQKRHNRTLERLLREAELAAALSGTSVDALQPAWRTLMLHQFHDILPGTSIPEVFDQAEPAWRNARRVARRQRDRALARWLEAGSDPPEARGSGPERPAPSQVWWLVPLLPQSARLTTVRLPPGLWRHTGTPLPQQACSSGGRWVQVRRPPGVRPLRLERLRQVVGDGAAPPGPLEPVTLEPVAGGGWTLGNGRLTARLGSAGVEGLMDAGRIERLAAPVQLCRWTDRGAFWDAWDIPRRSSAPTCRSPGTAQARWWRLAPSALSWSGGAAAASAPGASTCGCGRPAPCSS